MDGRWRDGLRAHGVRLPDNDSLLGKAVAELAGLRIETIRLAGPWISAAGCYRRGRRCIGQMKFIPMAAANRHRARRSRLHELRASLGCRSNVPGKTSVVGSGLIGERSAVSAVGKRDQKEHDHRDVTP